MLRLLILACLFVGPTPAQAQTVTLPKALNVPVGRMAVVPIQSDGKVTKWVVLGDDLDVFREYDPDPSKIVLRVVAYKEGTYRLLAYTAKGDVPSEPAVCVVTAGTPGPDPGPDPGPSPGPDPFGSGPAGLKCLVVLETAEFDKLPKEQLAALRAADVLAYLNAHCAKDADGKTAMWRIWDQKISPANEAVVWQKVFARQRKLLPWLVVSNGKQWYEGPLPADKDALLALLRKYGGQ